MGRQESYEDMDQPLFIREQPSQVLEIALDMLRIRTQRLLEKAA